MSDNLAKYISGVLEVKLIDYTFVASCAWGSFFRLLSIFNLIFLYVFLLDVNVGNTLNSI